MSMTKETGARIQDIVAGLALVGGLLTVVIADYVLAPKGAEIAFIIDQRPTMKSLRDAVRERCLAMATKLPGQGLECRFAVIPFG